jgi:GTP-binding protein
MAARFVTSAPDVQSLPDLGLPEAAFAGRSNVGKSSLLGAVLGQRSLVRTSRTPGRTQHLNLFVLDDRLALVDLPGYGYAKLSKRDRARLATMLDGYLAHRRDLLGVVQLLDARRDRVTGEDRTLTESVLRHHRGLLVAITKIDLVAKNKRLHFVRRIEKDLGIPAGQALLCSARTGEGKKELVTRLLELVP